MMKSIRFFIVINVLTSSLLLAQNNEFLFDTNLAYIPAPFGQSHPSVAFDGTNYFVAWYDWSRGTSYHYDMSRYYNIYGCRIDPDGVVLDSAGIFVSYYVLIAGYLPCSPGITYGDGIFLVAWSDFRRGLGGDIYGARIDTNGVVLDPGGFEISVLPTAVQATPAVAFDGTNFFVAWYDQRVPFGSIYGCRVSPEGTILDPEGVLISNSGECLSVSVAFDGTNYLVVWGTWEDIYGARVDTTGNVLDTTAIAICTAPSDQSYAAVTFGGTNYFVVWVDSPFSNYADIYGARVDTTGVVLDTNGIAISTLPESEHHPSVTFDGINYLITWSDYVTTYCARVNTAGILIDPIPTVVSQDTIYESSSPCVAFDGTNYFIVRHTGWADGEVYGTRVDTSGIVVDTTAILLSLSAYPGRSSSAAFDGTNYFAIWEDYRDSASFCVYGTRIDTSGTILDPEGISIIDGAHPIIAFDGTNYLAVCSGMRGVRINTASTILDTIIISSNGGDYPAIIFDGRNYFTTWEYGHDIYGARIDTSGVVLDTNAIIISDGAYYDDHSSVAFDGTNYFVVWHYGTHETTFDIYGARVDTLGVLLDTIAITITIGSYRQWYPSVGFDGVNYFVTWEDRRNGYADIYGARVTPDGVVLDTTGIPICTASSGQYKPEIKFDGQNYCVIWEDWRNGDYTDIYGCYVTPSGTVIEEFVVSNQPNLQIEPALTKGLNKFLVTYTGFVDSLGARPANTMRIWGKFYPFTGIEEDVEFRIQDTRFGLHVFPNPFSKATNIKFQAPRAKSQVTMSIYDALGRVVKDFSLPTTYSLLHTEVSWSGVDNTGQKLSSGVYFCCLKVDDFITIRKIIKLK